MTSSQKGRSVFFCSPFLISQVTTIEKLGASSDELCVSSSIHHTPTVPRNQVETMEQLFTETVERLEDRVKQLEAPPVPNSSSMMSNGSMHSGGGRVRSNPNITKSMNSTTRRPIAGPAAPAPAGGARPAAWATKRPVPGHATTTRNTNHHLITSGRQHLPAHSRSSSSISTSSNTSSASNNRYSGRHHTHHPSITNNNMSAAPGGTAAAMSTFGGRARIEPGRLRAKSWGSGGGGSSFGVGGVGGRFHRPAFQL